ncbi:flagellin N-terminal helical domain-containing protein [Pectinatus sottacetonis]|uniref:flagellin N-terminal helical domain-containing protein n=1 Tax=Pectinatus sottacetonis TaxID=1002795 RepID=UPI0018C72C65|nr:flagellin [Pectinatus sottacetonis]
MSLVVKNNMSALNTLNIMGRNSKALSSSLEKVSSGMKINSAADNPAGYAISERMRTQIRSLDQDNTNAQNGQNMLKTAEGSVSSTVDILKTLKEKVLDAANDTNTTYDRQTMQDYLDQAVDQINDNANTTYNGQLLIDGSKDKQMDKDTAVVYSNSSLSTTTDFSTALTALYNRNGQKLDIQSADKLSISFVSNGKTFTTSVTVSSLGSAAGLKDVFTLANSIAGVSGTANVGEFATGSVHTNSVIGTTAEGVTMYTADGSSVLSIASSTAGLAGNIAGFTISITGTDGNIKKSVNSVLDAWDEQISAQDKSGDNAITMQIGTKSNQAIRVGLSDMRARALGLQGVSSDGRVQNLDITTRANANASINVLDNAVQKALKEQTKIGSVESRLDYTQDNLTTQSENVQASESTIRDSNMAKEMTEYTKNNVLMQASQAMLAQANQSSQNVLQLLR